MDVSCEWKSRFCFVRLFTRDPPVVLLNPSFFSKSDFLKVTEKEACEDMDQMS